MEAKEQKSLGTYDVSKQTVKIPAGHELEGLILKTQDGKKVIITIWWQLLDNHQQKIIFHLKYLFQIQLICILALSYVNVSNSPYSCL